MRAAEVNMALSMALSGHAADAVQMLRPIAELPAATPRMRHDLAVALTLAGDQQGAARMLNGDLTPEQVQRALLAYRELIP